MVIQLPPYVSNYLRLLAVAVFPLLVASIYMSFIDGVAYWRSVLFAVTWGAAALFGSSVIYFAANGRWPASTLKRLRVLVETFVTLAAVLAVGAYLYVIPFTWSFYSVASYVSTVYLLISFIAVLCFLARMAYELACLGFAGRPSRKFRWLEPQVDSTLGRLTPPQTERGS